MAIADRFSTSGRKRNKTMTVNSVNSVSFSSFSTFGSASPTASTATTDASTGSTASGTTSSASSAAASSGTGGTGQVDTITKTGTTSGYGLSTDDFMKLFLAQLQNQDPTKPMDDSQMLDQLAQMTQVQTLQGVESALKGSQLAQSSALIGKTVTGTDVNGTAVTGVVGSVVQSTDAGLVLKVGSQYVKPDDVTTVTAGS
jgi:flagellar basal-body rod modification protein FlgD